MTPLDPKGLREMLAKASARPWRVETPRRGRYPRIRNDEHHYVMETAYPGASPVANLLLACAAVNALPALLDELDALRSRAEGAEALLREARGALQEPCDECEGFGTVFDPATDDEDDDADCPVCARSGRVLPSQHADLAARIDAHLTPAPQPKPDRCTCGHVCPPMGSGEECVHAPTCALAPQPKQGGEVAP